MRSLKLTFLIPWFVAVGHAETIVFMDGRTWTDVRIVSAEPTSLIVMHDKALVTVHAAEVTEENRAALKLRLPSAEEVAARASEDERIRKQAGDRAAQKHPEVVSSVVRRDGGGEQSGGGATIHTEPQIKREFSNVVYASGPDFVSPSPVTRLVGRVLKRLPSGVIVQADGMPEHHDFGDVGWIIGTIFIEENSQLIATTVDTPISGKVLPAGEYRFTDSTGIVHVMSAWRF